MCEWIVRANLTMTKGIKPGNEKLILAVVKMNTQRQVATTQRRWVDKSRPF